MKKGMKTSVFSGGGISVSLQTAANRPGEALYGTFLAGNNGQPQKAAKSKRTSAAGGNRRLKAQKKGGKALGTLVNAAHSANAGTGQPAAGYLTPAVRQTAARRPQNP